MKSSRNIPSVLRANSAAAHSFARAHLFACEPRYFITAQTRKRTATTCHANAQAFTASAVNQASQRFETAAQVNDALQSTEALRDLRDSIEVYCPLPVYKYDGTNYDKKRGARNRFLKCFSVYINLAISSELIVRHVHGGLGVFSQVNLPSKHHLIDLSGHKSRVSQETLNIMQRSKIDDCIVHPAAKRIRISHSSKSSRSRASTATELQPIHTDSDSDSSTHIPTIARVRGICDRIMFGPLAFINITERGPANCDPYSFNAIGVAVDHWSAITTNRPIAANCQITISYGTAYDAAVRLAASTSSCVAAVSTTLDSAARLTRSTACLPPSVADLASAEHTASENSA